MRCWTLGTSDVSKQVPFCCTVHDATNGASLSGVSLYWHFDDVVVTMTPIVLEHLATIESSMLDVKMKRTSFSALYLCQCSCVAYT